MKSERAAVSERVALSVGDARECEMVVSATLVQSFAELSGDVNPLHLDASYARQRGFPGPVAHGMLALSAISRLIGTALPGPGALWLSQTVHFAQPVFVGDAITARVIVEQVSEATGVVSLKTEVRRTRTSQVVLIGSAKVRCPGVQDVTPIVAEPVRPAARAMSTATRVAIVTGSSRGIGRAIAAALAEDGAAVVVHFLERERDAIDVVEGIRDSGGRASSCRADLMTAGGVDSLYEHAVEQFGHVDILVNNATPPIIPKPVLECQWSDFASYLDVYLRASLELSQRAVPGMRDRGVGRIINVLSSHALGVPPARLAPYVTAKAALAGLTKALAVELGPFGITVNAVAPSVVPTEQTTGLTDRARQLAAAQTPMRRLGNVDDIAASVRFLASDGAGFITGAVMPVTGGGLMS